MCPEKLKLLHAFILSLAVRSSHYTREINKYKQYLDVPDKLSISQIHEDYLNTIMLDHPGAEGVSYDYFRLIWNTCYNISSTFPKVDICPVCYTLECRITELQTANKKCTDLKEQLNAHKAKADKAYDSLKMAGDTKMWKPTDWKTLCIDLQQTHTIPKSPFGPDYFMRKLNVYNFCVFELQTKEPYFYVWPEYDGMKGAAEIYSCIHKYLEENVFCKPNYPKKLRIMADNASGQNKNNKLVLALLRLVHLKYLVRIELGFMVPGHSYMQCDKAFGIIANSLKKSQVPSPDVLCKFIKEARKPAFKVSKLERNDIFNVDIFTETDCKKRVAKIRTSTENPKAFSSSSVIVLRERYPNGYILKANFDEKDEQGEFINVQLPRAQGDLDLGKISLEPKYLEQIKLCPNKLKDLTTMSHVLRSGGQWIKDLIAIQDKLEGSYIPNDDECEPDHSMEFEPVRQVEQQNALNDEDEDED